MGTPAFPELASGGARQRLIAPAVQLVAINDPCTELQPRCNIRSPSFARPTPAHRRKSLMTIFATLMLTAIALYVMMQVDDLRP
jgi:hypothetical protein